MDLLENPDNIDITYWYYRRKFNLILRFFESAPFIESVCDVGAGRAIFSQELSKRRPETLFVASDINYTIDWLEKNDIPNLKYCHDYRKSKVVLLNDVLEHLESPVDFLGSIVKKSDSGTTFLITVPAYQHLWSSHDVHLKHFRRYTRKTLKENVENSGLRIVEMKYIYWSLYLVVLFYRKVLRHQQASNLKQRPILDSLLKRLMTLEEWFSDLYLPGISIWCVAVKP